MKYCIFVYQKVIPPLWNVGIELCCLPPIIPENLPQAPSNESLVGNLEVKEAATALLWTLLRKCPTLVSAKLPIIAIFRKC